MAAEQPKRRDGSRRDAILAGASRLFAERGYDGASLRDVAAAADVRLSLIDYYFGTKEALFGAVLASKADVIAQGLADSLDRRRADMGGRLDLTGLVEAYVEPHWRRAVLDDEWRDFTRIVFGIISRPDRLDLSAPLLNTTRPVTDRYELELTRMFPQLTEEDVRAAMRLINLSLAGSILHVTSMGLPTAAVEHRWRLLVRFCIGGVAEIAAAAGAGGHLAAQDIRGRSGRG